MNEEKYKELVEAEIKVGSVDCGSRNIGLDMWISENIEEIHISPHDYEMMSIG